MRAAAAALRRACARFAFALVALPAVAGPGLAQAPAAPNVAQLPPLAQAPAAPSVAQLPPLAQPPAAPNAAQPPAAPDTSPAPPLAQAPAAQPRFYFFSPDWRPADLNILTERVHVALLEQGIEVSFQGFARYEDFLRQVAGLQPTFLLAPGWFQNTAASDLGLYLQPIATPLRHKRATYRKALITRSDLGSIADLTRGSIAAAVYAVGPGSERAVLESLHLDAGSTKVVPVPKDLDGLLALGFEQVDAALVTAQQFDLLATSNPEAAARLQVLAFSAPIPLPGVFAGPQTTVEDRRHMAAALANFNATGSGREVLGMLGYDSFEPVTATAAVPQEQPLEQPEVAPPAHRHARNRKAK